MRLNTSAQLLVNTTSPSGLGSHTGNADVCTFAKPGLTLSAFSVQAGFYYDRLNFTNSQYFVVNSGGTGVYIGNGATSWTAHSDERLKENISDISEDTAWNHCKSARAVSFNWKPDNYPDDQRLGFIAQDWETNYPEVISTSTEEVDGITDPKGIQYTETLPVMMAALKKAISKIETLETEVETLKTKVAALESTE